MIDTGYKYLIERICKLANQLPEEWVDKLAAVLITAEDLDWSQIHSLAINSVPKSSTQIQIASLVNFWREEAPDVSSDSVALMLLSAKHSVQDYSQRQNIELVWTGPVSESFAMRRTDQALLQVIREAKERLWIVSFAVYKIQTIVEALGSAAERGISISILVESPDESEGRIAYDTFQPFGSKIREQAKFYIWPREKRSSSPDEKFGTLHAKLAVVDGNQLFISSANLTEYAMHLNMELGILILGGSLPNQVEAHFTSLIDRGVIREVPYGK